MLFLPLICIREMHADEAWTMMTSAITFKCQSLDLNVKGMCVL